LEEEYNPSRRHIFGEYTLYCRPHMRHFLKNLDEKFHLSVWTRLPAAIATPVVDFLFRGLECLKSLRVLALEECISIVDRGPANACRCRPPPHVPDTSCPAHPVHVSCDPDLQENIYIQFPDHPEGQLRLKVLHKGVWDSDRFRAPNFRANSTNTLLVDCSPESTILNPIYNAIFPLPYAGSEHDRILLGTLASYLRSLLDSGLSVSQYVSSNPFCWGPDIPLRQTKLGLRVRACALWQDGSLLLEYPDVVKRYSRHGNDHFIPRRSPRENKGKKIT
jgi:hypothetical protein